MAYIVRKLIVLTAVTSLTFFGMVHLRGIVPVSSAQGASHALTHAPATK